MPVSVVVKIGLLIVVGGAVLALVVYPAFQNPNRNQPLWVRDGNAFVSSVGSAIRRYKSEHSDNIPETLGDLYPQYTRDRRVTQKTALFGGELLVIDYRKPEVLTSQTVVLELRLLRPHSGPYYRPIRLWGDFHQPVVM